MRARLTRQPAIPLPRDPIVSFTLKAEKEAPLTITWTDTKGATYKQSVNVAFAAA